MKENTENSRKLIESRPGVDGVNEILLETLDHIDNIRELSQKVINDNKENK